MGEAKRRQLIDEVTRKLVDEGKLIEAGWASLRMMAVAPDAPQVQLDEMRMAFFAGAQHLFGSLMSFLEAGEEPTETDLKRMDAIHKELGEFIEQFELRNSRTGGHA
jgi:hypothetical protein